MEANRSGECSADKERHGSKRLFVGHYQKRRWQHESFISAASFRETTRVTHRKVQSLASVTTACLKEKRGSWSTGYPRYGPVAYHAHVRSASANWKQQGVTAADVEEALSAGLNREDDVNGGHLGVVTHT